MKKLASKIAAGLIVAIAIDRAKPYVDRFIDKQFGIDFSDPTKK